MIIEPQRGAVMAELNRQKISELYGCVSIVARFSAQHAFDAEIEVMEQRLERSHDAAIDKREMNQINWELLFAIYHAAQNRVLLKSIDAIADVMVLLRGRDRSQTPAPGRKGRAGTHQEFIQSAFEFHRRKPPIIGSLPLQS